MVFACCDITHDSFMMTTGFHLFSAHNANTYDVSGEKHLKPIMVFFDCHCYRDEGTWVFNLNDEVTFSPTMHQQFNHAVNGT